MVQPIPGAVERKIYFCRIWMGRDEQGNRIVADLRGMLTAIGQLIAGPDWYQEMNDENVLCLLPEGQVNGNLTARFCIVRRAGLPQLEGAGQIADLDLADNQGLLEAVHLVFFDNNVVGVEYNHFGPRISRLPSYLQNKVPNFLPARMRIANLVRGDPAAILDGLEGLHLLDMSILPNQMALVEQHNRGLGAAFAASADIAGEPEVVTLNIKPTRNSQPRFLQDVREALRALVQNEEFRVSARRLKVQGRRQGQTRTEVFDLLNDDITASVQLIKINPRGRALNSNHAYDQIIQAHYDLRDDIQQAVELLDAEP